MPTIRSPILAWDLLFSGLLICSSAAAGPITVNPANPRWLLNGGAPFFMCGPGDPEDFSHRGSLNPDGTRDGDQDAIIQKLTGTGANCLWMTAVRSHGGDGGYRENPFVLGDPGLGVNEAVLDQWEGWVTDFDAAGIVSFFVFYDDGTLVWDTGSVVGEDEAEFIRTLVDRFEHHEHLIWCVCEEFQEAFTQARVVAIADEIAQNDDFAHPIATHQLSGHVFYFADAVNLDCSAMHASRDNVLSTIHAKCVNAWDYAAGRYNVIMSESIGHYSNRTEARRLSWAAALGGTYVMVHSMDVISTPIEALEDCGRIVSFFESAPFQEMSPRDDLARAGTDYVFGDPAVGYLLYAAGEHTAATPSGFGADVALSVLPSTPTSAGSSLRAESWAHTKGRYRN